MFLTDEQNEQLRSESIDYLNNEVITAIVTPLADREDIPEVKDMLVDNGVLLLPDDDEARSTILEVAAQYSAMDLKICRRKRPV